MARNAADILEGFRRDHANRHAGAIRNDINLTLRPAYMQALERLGNPHLKLPPVFHVAGTNGKGSTCAFLRAIAEASGLRVHVYTSPHLVSFHERIRIAGQLIEEPELVGILTGIEQVSTLGELSYFEAATAAAFVAFTRHPADMTILEVGLGGRLDATNIVPEPVATVISRISFDHREYLGDTLAGIAREKAGIMRPGVPCFAAAQPDATVVATLKEAAQTTGASLSLGNVDWSVEPTADGFVFQDATRRLELPTPALLGQHQFANAGLAIAALAAWPQPFGIKTIGRGLRNVEWPARLQRLTQGELAGHLPPDTELWLDGGHNDSAGEVLAAQAAIWQQQDHTPKPLHLIMGMLTTKIPSEFMQPLQPYTASVHTVAIPHEPLSFSASDLAQNLAAANRANTIASEGVHAAMAALTQGATSKRILICGSLYLAGHILHLNSVEG